MCRTAYIPGQRLQRRDAPVIGTPGFTLVELLVVVALIALLAALSIGAMMLLPERARARGTEATITKLSTALERKVAAIQQGRSTVRPCNVDLWLSGADPSTLSGGNPSLAQVIALMRTLRQELPEQFGTSSATYSSYDLHYPPGGVLGDWSQIDLSAPAGLLPGTLVQPVSALPSGSQVFAAKISQADLSRHSPETTRGELLYLILSGAGGHGGGAEEFAPDEIKDTDGDGLPEFVDKFAGGRPIQFFLWPTHHETEHPSLGAASNANDPNQLLIDSSWVLDGPRRSAYERLFHWVTRDGPTVTSPPAAVQARSYPTIPLIVSGGPDGEFGLMNDPPPPTGTGEFYSRAVRDPSSGGFDDNIDNHSLRVR